MFDLDTNQGFCTECKRWTHDCAEPDAENYTCPECGADAVVGAEIAVMCGWVVPE